MKPVYYENGKLVMIDQTLLPGEKILREYDDYRDIIDAIKTMIVRGAPAIGVSAAGIIDEFIGVPNCSSTYGVLCEKFGLVCGGC